MVGEVSQALVNAVEMLILQNEALVKRDVVVRR